MEKIAMWEGGRRAHLLQTFREEIYGAPPPVMPFQVESIEEGEAFGGLGIRSQLSLRFSAEHAIALLVYRPAGVVGPVPVFLGMNYYGNRSIVADPCILPGAASPCDKKLGVAASRWPLLELLKQGYAVATFCYEDVAPDRENAWRNGAAALIGRGGSKPPGATEAGAVAWWAWGMSRVMDYLLEHPATYRGDRVMLVGQSRHGKASLWAGAEDQRFAAVFSNCSGCTGAALAKRKFGETVAILNTARPHWFCGNYKKYNHREEMLPVDQHQLLALMAPRPVYIASATEDLSADPLGEYLAAYHTQKIYAAYGKFAHLPPMPPAPDRSIGRYVGYHTHTGIHDITAEDWRHFVKFVERSLP